MVRASARAEVAKGWRCCRAEHAARRRDAAACNADGRGSRNSSPPRAGAARWNAAAVLAIGRRDGGRVVDDLRGAQRSGTARDSFVDSARPSSTPRHHWCRRSLDAERQRVRRVLGGGAVERNKLSQRQVFIRRCGFSTRAKMEPEMSVSGRRSRARRRRSSIRDSIGGESQRGVSVLRDDAQRRGDRARLRSKATRCRVKAMKQTRRARAERDALSPQSERLEVGRTAVCASAAMSDTGTADGHSSGEHAAIASGGPPVGPMQRCRLRSCAASGEGRSEPRTRVDATRRPRHPVRRCSSCRAANPPRRRALLRRSHTSLRSLVPAISRCNSATS